MSILCGRKKPPPGGGKVIAGYNTAIWLDSISSIIYDYGVRGHLNDALNQGADLITFVIYNLPNRDYWAPHGSEELLISEDGMERYKTEFIDPTAAIFTDPLYAEIRIICIIESKSLSSLLTSWNTTRCQEAAEDGGYVESIQYLLDSFGEIPNVYKYMDIAHSGWLGWNTNLEEPFLHDPDLMIGGALVRSADFYEWNAYFGDIEFTLEMRNQLIHRGFPESLGIIIDTSWNAWPPL